MLMLAAGVGRISAASFDELPPSDESARVEISGVIRFQIDALAAGDFARAYTCAARGIQEKFDHEAFTAMIRSSYPQLIEARYVSVLAVRASQTQASADVRIVSASGAIAHFHYVLERESSAWKIVGVIPYNAPSVSA